MRLLISYCIIKCVFTSFFVPSSTSVIPGYGDETRHPHHFYAFSSSSRHLRKRNQPRRELPRQMYFVYSKTPEHLIIPARRSGEIERIGFTDSASKISDEDARMELYAKHFAQCEEINYDDNNNTVATKLQNSIHGIRQVDPKLDVNVLTDAIGVDMPTAELCAISSPSLLANTIRKACLKNELKFQCAFGFLNDFKKIQEHINIMKQNDGNFKVMLESECKFVENQNAYTENADDQRSVYTCINQNAAQILQRCRFSIEAYNSTRRTINKRMQDTFIDTLTTIENHVEKAIASRDSEELDKVLNRGEHIMAKTLNELANTEALKCHQFSLMERCVIDETRRECSTHAAHSLRTILRVGYLSRERGAVLNHHFKESNVREHRACRKFTDSNDAIKNQTTNVRFSEADNNEIDRISA